MTPEELHSYMLRRDGIINVLNELVWHWELAPGLVALIGSEYVTPDVIDGIEKILKDAIKNVKDVRVQQKLQIWVDKIKKIKESENHELKSERDEASQSVLQNFI